jgi:DNA-binding transcriptional ArsR family regulator
MAIDEGAREEIRSLHASFCQALSDPRRLLIIRALGAGELTASELTRAVPLDAASVQHHLAVLQDHGLLTAVRRGRSVRHALASPKILAAVDLLFEVMEESVAATPVAGPARENAV